MSEIEHRRRRLVGIGLLGTFAVADSRAQGAVESAKPIVQPRAATPVEFMRRAIALRDEAMTRGDQGYGAVVVKDGRIVGEAGSQVVSRNDPTGHAELEAIRDAARRLGSRDLAGCVLYGNATPCPMCMGGAYWARISRYVVGLELREGGAPRLC